MTTPTADSVLDSLRTAAGGPDDGPARSASALRLRCPLEPAGGPGTKVMPPTYAGQGGPTYIREERVIDGEKVVCVSLDSVASQANRMEVALSEELTAGRVHLPTIWVDQKEFGVNSALDFSHRCFDAWVEDALLDGTRFGETELWKEQLATSKRRDLSALMSHSPSAIVFGCWASRVKNPQGSARLSRILASEILAVGAEVGERAAGRLDVHNVSSGLTVYDAKEGRITLDPDEAEKEKDQPIKFPGKRGEAGRPAAAGYGNVTPGLAQHGGITMRHALQIATVSLPGLRECGFPQDGSRSAERDVAGRLMLAALALRMLALQVEHGYDLRSGCLLVPAEDPTVELLDRLGQPVSAWPIVGTPSEEVLEQAIAEGSEQGIDWHAEGLSLEASDAQLELLRQSLAEAEPGEA